jgi:hypothetical protein
MKYLGAHVSASGGVENAPVTISVQGHLHFLQRIRSSGLRILYPKQALISSGKIAKSLITNLSRFYPTTAI